MKNLSRRRFLGSAALAAVPALAVTTAAGTPEPDLRRSQLFLDDYWIEDSMRLQRVWPPAEIRPEPVLKPEAPWEGNQVAMFGSVFRLGDEWRMYYMPYNRPEPALFCMATSSNGLHWERPRLGLAEYRGSKANNIVFAPGPGASHDGPTVCHDPADPAAPFKMIYYGYGKGSPSGLYVAFSKDGIDWRHRPDPVLTTTGDRTNVLAERDYQGKFVAYTRNRDMMSRFRARTVSRIQSDDFIRWTDPEPILRPDLLDDPNTELYGMAGVKYEGIYLGMLERWYNNPDVIEVQLAWSRDGLAWRRPAERRPFIAPEYPWNKGWNSCASTAPLRTGNRLWFFFGGRSAAHGREFPRSYGAVGLATAGVDEFAAIRADFIEGMLLTRPMLWPGGELALRSTHTRYPAAHPSSGGGRISVEVRDQANQPVPGFSGSERATHDMVSPAPFSTTEPLVKWPGARSLDTLKGRRIRLAFFLRDARLYSFRAASSSST